MSIPNETLSQETLSTLLSPGKTESYKKLQELKALALQWEKQQAVNPFKIYCSRTGREVGILSDSIIHSSLASIDSKDNEEILDELTTRCLLSARPSPDLIYLSGESMKALISYDPVTALIFFLSKAFERQNRDFMAICPTHKSSRKKHQFDSTESAVDRKLQWNRGLVELHHLINNKIPMKNIKRFCYLLLTIDAKLGLHKLTPPSDLWGFDLLTKENTFPQCMKLIRHYRKALEEIEKANNLFIQNSNTLSLETARAIRQTTGKKKSTKQRAKQRKINNLTSQLDSIFTSLGVATDSPETPAKPKTPGKKPAKLKPLGFKINIGRKEA